MRALIVGAGPAGLACGIHLARAGVEVQVLEAGPGIRRRPCGEGVMPPGVEALDRLGILDAVRDAGSGIFRGISYWSDGREAAAADFPIRPGGHHGLGLRRPELEATMLRELESHRTARVHFKSPLKRLIRSGSRVTGVEAGGHVLTADAVIGCDGARSRVRRDLGLDVPPPRQGRFGVCGHLARPVDIPQLSRVEVHLVGGGELYRTPCGPGREGWILLTSGERVRSWAGQFEGRLREHLRTNPPLHAALEQGQFMGPMRATGPLSRCSRRAADSGVLLAGDAAGFLDAITGEGLALGLHLAEEAARIVLERNGPLLEVDESEYCRVWREATRHPWLLTRGLLFLVANRWLARPMLERLGRRPQMMSRLLGVNCGYERLTEIPLREWVRLLAA